MFRKIIYLKIFKFGYKLLLCTNTAVCIKNKKNDISAALQLKLKYALKIGLQKGICIKKIKWRFTILTVLEYCISLSQFNNSLETVMELKLISLIEVIF